MTGLKILIGALLISGLLTGVSGAKDSVFVYDRLGGDALLPCTKLASPDCSSVTWTFFKGGLVRYSKEVSGGRVNPDSDKSNRTAVSSNCSLVLRGLVVEDAGSYVCLVKEEAVTDVYLSLLSIGSVSPITELRPGGNLVLTCVLFTYYDAGSCKPYSSTFSILWVDEDGEQLPKNDTRFKLTENTRCNVTLVTKLQAEDNGRKWRCRVDTTEKKQAAFLDFRSSFLFQDAQTDQIVQPSVAEECPAELPISRIVLCVALPLMVCIVGFFRWKSDRKTAKASAAAIEMQDIY